MCSIITGQKKEVNKNPNDIWESPRDGQYMQRKTDLVWLYKDGCLKMSARVHANKWCPYQSSPIPCFLELFCLPPHSRSRQKYSRNNVLYMVMSEVKRRCPVNLHQIRLKALFHDGWEAESLSDHVTCEDLFSPVLDRMEKGLLFLG